MSRPFLQRIKNRQPINFYNFYRARALRILPLYLIVVSVAWLVTGKQACLKAMFFIPINFEAFPFSVPWWSLSTEIQFYIVLPLLMAGLSQPRLRAMLLIALSAGLILYAFIAMNTRIIEENIWLSSNLPGRASAFVAGGIAAWITVRRENQPYLPAGLVSVFFLVSLALLVLLLHWYGTTDPRRVLSVFPMYHYVEALLWSVVLFCLIQPTCFLKKAFCNTALDSLGRISYSLYLLHLPLIFYMVFPVLKKAKFYGGYEMALAAMIAASFVITLIAAAASYHYIERPFLALKARRLAR